MSNRKLKLIGKAKTTVVWTLTLAFAIIIGQQTAALNCNKVYELDESCDTFNDVCPNCAYTAGHCGSSVWRRTTIGSKIDFGMNAQHVVATEFVTGQDYTGEILEWYCRTNFRCAELASGFNTVCTGVASEPCREWVQSDGPALQGKTCRPCSGFDYVDTNLEVNELGFCDQY